MASRQKQPAEDPQQGLEEEETVSGAGEGDEIMEEVEEQEDGYSKFIITLFDPFALLSLLCLVYWCRYGYRALPPAFTFISLTIPLESITKVTNG